MGTEIVKIWRRNTRGLGLHQQIEMQAFLRRMLQMQRQFKEICDMDGRVSISVDLLFDDIRTAVRRSHKKFTGKKIQRRVR